MSEWIVTGEETYNHLSGSDAKGEHDPADRPENTHYEWRTTNLDLPGGKKATYFGNLIRPCVHVVAVEDDETTYLVRQTRPNVRQPGQLIIPKTLELPGGFSTKGLSLKESANKELGQEIRRKAGTLEHIMEIYPSTGISSEIDTIFVGTDLHDDPDNPRDEDTELDMKIIVGDFMDLYGELAESRDPVSGQTFAAMTKAALHLGMLAPRGRKTL